MRAREFQDIIEVLIVPSLDRALDELTRKHGSKRRARLLVQQSVDQLRGMMGKDPAPELPFGKPAGHRHDYSHDQTTEGFGVCKCGVVEDSAVASTTDR